jgi:hypothetical protein
MLEKGLEQKHSCLQKRARIKAEKAQKAKERREKVKKEGLVSYVRKLPEKESMVFMEPMLDGSYTQMRTEKYPWKCKICGLIWQTREDAESCPYTRDNPFMRPKPPHGASYTRLYGVRYVENGVPRGNLREIAFHAMRKEDPEALPEGKKWDIVVLTENPYGHEDIRSAVNKAKDAEFKALQEYADSLEASQNPDPDVSELYPEPVEEREE